MKEINLIYFFVCLCNIVLGSSDDDDEMNFDDGFTYENNIDRADDNETDPKDPTSICWMTLNAAKHFKILDEIDARFAKVREEVQESVNKTNFDETMIHLEYKGVCSWDKLLVDTTYLFDIARPGIRHSKSTIDSRDGINSVISVYNLAPNKEFQNTRGVAIRESYAHLQQNWMIPSGLNLGGLCMLRMPDSMLYFHRMKLRNNTHFRVDFLYNDLSNMMVKINLALNDLHLKGAYERSLTEEDPSVLIYTPTFGQVEFLLKDVRYKIEGRYRLIKNRLLIELVTSEIFVDNILMTYINQATIISTLKIEKENLGTFMSRMKINLDKWIKDYFNDYLIYTNLDGLSNIRGLVNYDKEKGTALEEFTDMSIKTIATRLRFRDAKSVLLPSFTFKSLTGLHFKLYDGVINGLDSMFRRSVATGYKKGGIRKVDCVVGFSNLKVVYKYETWLPNGMPPLAGVLTLSSNELTAHLALAMVADPETIDLDIEFLGQMRPESLTVEGAANIMISNFKHLLEHQILATMSNTLIHGVKMLKSLPRCASFLKHPIQRYKEGDRFFYFPGDGDNNLHFVDAEEPADIEFIERFTSNPVNNGYWLYTRYNPLTAHIIGFGDERSVASSNFNFSKVTVFLAHGWHGDGETEMNRMLTEAFLLEADVNVIVLDWKALAAKSYFTAKRGTAGVGRGLGQFVKWLVSLGVSYERVHLVGFSLGGHLVGNAGRATGGLVKRVTALDPAGPGWRRNSDDRVVATDAKYVEVIHTNTRLYGYTHPCGDADFYPNGGALMPGCYLSTCSHPRAYEYMASSIKYNHFLANECATLRDATRNRCTGEFNRMGNSDLSKSRSGIFRVNTKSGYPY